MEKAGLLLTEILPIIGVILISIFAVYWDHKEVVKKSKGIEKHFYRESEESEEIEED